MSFIFKKRIYGYECDIYGHLNNSNYLQILEAARSEAMQDMGVTIRQMLDARWHIYILHFELDYIKAVQLEDIIEIRSKIIWMNRVKGDWIQEIYNPAGELCFMAKLTAVFAYEGKPARLAPQFYDVFMRYVETNAEVKSDNP